MFAITHDTGSESQKTYAIINSWFRKTFCFDCSRLPCPAGQLCLPNTVVPV